MTQQTPELKTIDNRFEEIYKGFAKECANGNARNRTKDGHCGMKERTDNLNISLNCEYLNGLMCIYPNKQD